MSVRDTNVIRRRFEWGGVVQGVGFRPFLAQLAMRWQVTGFVRNLADGVEVEVQGNSAQVEGFRDCVQSNPPPMAVLDRFSEYPCELRKDEQSFAILESHGHQSIRLGVPPDISTCDACREEMRTPGNRRYRYPFVNCAHCGPRFTIIQSLPYDRDGTTMSGFAMCEACRREYEDPTDRRYHAQPIACPECGPTLWYEDSNAPKSSHPFAFRPRSGALARRSDIEKALRSCLDALHDGKIVAVKGIGGFHLVCDAFRADAVRKLKERKRRDAKPLAVMMRDRETCEAHGVLNPRDVSLLESPARPIVLLPWKSSSRSRQSIASCVAPHLRHLGIMLPYSPLHFLLMEEFEGLVMTSGNLSGEPIAMENEDAWHRLKVLVDGFLFHDRPIESMCDDSVVRSDEGRMIPIRRSRGYAPLPIRLRLPTISNDANQATWMAVGAEIKGTVCWVQQDYAIMSQHLGDMENLETIQALERSVAHLSKLYRSQPKAIAADLHPQYLSSQWAQRFAQQASIPLLHFQHHHAHVASLLAEHRWDPSERIVAVCMDGTGYGTDGAIWGGECLEVRGLHFKRLAHCEYFGLPGGDAAIRYPYRTALSLLTASDIPWGDSIEPCRRGQSELRFLAKQMAQGTGMLPTSSIGRLFDAVASLMGVCHDAAYEAQGRWNWKR